MRRAITLIFSTLLLAGCAAETMPAWELAGEPGLLFTVKQYYERHAVEEAGFCRNPLLEGVSRTEILEESDERLTVRLGYYYRDFVHDGEDCSRLRPNRCFIMRECRGFAERTFTIAKGAEGGHVLEMSGASR